VFAVGQVVVGGVPGFWRVAPAAQAGSAPVLYVHGNPTHSEDWLPFLERTGGYAPDLPGFGRSGKPADFDYSAEGYGRWLEAYAERVGLERFSLVLHDWGAVGLMLAQSRPERVERLVVIDAVPFLPGYRWHWAARMWRRPLIGELFMGFSTKFGFKQLSKQATPKPGPMPDELIESVWKHFDHGTQRAILKLYRSAPVRDL
jgi:pimeloyl-ACP methyl ester carboxylesterase